MSTEKKKKLTKEEIIGKLGELSEKDLQKVAGGLIGDGKLIEGQATTSVPYGAC